MEIQYILVLLSILVIIVLFIINEIYEPQLIWLDQNLYLFYSVKRDKEINRNYIKII